MGDSPDVADASDATSAIDATPATDATGDADAGDHSRAAHATAETFDGPPDAGDSTNGQPSRTRSLLVWALAAFHAALLVAVAVALLYFAGLAGNGLEALDTWVGVLAYLYLWGVTWWTNRRMLEAIGTGLVTGAATPSDVFVEAMKWGAAAGFLVFLPLLVVGIALFVGAGGPEAIPFVVVGAGIGSGLSAGVGVVVGGSFALLDLLLVRLAGAWLPVEDPGRTPTQP